MNRTDKPAGVPEVFSTFLKIDPAFSNDTPAMSASTRCEWDGMGVVGGEFGGNEIENNNLFFDDVEFEKNTIGRCEHRAEQQKKVAWQTRTFSLQCATTGTFQHKRDSGRSLLSTADPMMLTVVQVVVS
jgi:hypothetical protein